MQVIDILSYLVRLFFTMNSCLLGISRSPAALSSPIAAPSSTASARAREPGTAFSKQSGRPTKTPERMYLMDDRRCEQQLDTKKITAVS